MTLDDLIAIYDAARKGAPVMGDMRRAAIAAVAEWLEHRSLDWPDNAEGKIAAALRAAAGSAPTTPEVK